MVRVLIDHFINEEGCEGYGQWKERVNGELHLIHFLVVYSHVFDLQRTESLNETGEDGETWGNGKVFVLFCAINWLVFGSFSWVFFLTLPLTSETNFKNTDDYERKTNNL